MELTYGNAIRQALYDELEEDPKVFILGEDIRSNLYGYTEGLFEKFGADRIINIPLSEAGAMGLANGAAMCGLHPIIDLTTSNFLYVSMDQIASITAKMHYINNGKLKFPLTIFVSNMEVGGNAAQHADRAHSLFKNIPGLKVICPASPQDMYFMLRNAIKDENPVLCFADRSLFWMKGDVNKDADPEDFVKSKVIAEGKDLTIVTVSACRKMVEDVLPDLYECGIVPEVVDVRSVVPLDKETIFKSIKHTGKVVICDTANKTGSVAEEIASLISENAFYSLKKPICIIAGEDTPLPFAQVMERKVIVTKEKILCRILDFMNT